MENRARPSSLWCSLCLTAAAATSLALGPHKWLLWDPEHETLTWGPPGTLAPMAGDRVVAQSVGLSNLSSSVSFITDERPGETLALG